MEDLSSCIVKTVDVDWTQTTKSLRTCLSAFPGCPNNTCTGGNILSVNWPEDVEQVGVYLTNTDRKSLINMNHWCCPLPTSRPAIPRRSPPAAGSCWKTDPGDCCWLTHRRRASYILSLTASLWVYHKRRYRMSPPLNGVPGGGVMSSSAGGASYAAVLTLTLDPSGPWHPRNIQSQPLSSPIYPLPTLRGSRLQRGPVKLPELAATSQEPHRRSSLVCLR